MNLQPRSPARCVAARMAALALSAYTLSPFLLHVAWPPGQSLLSPQTPHTTLAWGWREALLSEPLWGPLAASPSGFLVPPAQVPPPTLMAVQDRVAAVLADDDPLGEADGQGLLPASLKDLQHPLVLLAGGRVVAADSTEPTKPRVGPGPSVIAQEQGLFNRRERLAEVQRHGRVRAARCLL